LTEEDFAASLRGMLPRLETRNSFENIEELHIPLLGTALWSKDHTLHPPVSVGTSIAHAAHLWFAVQRP
jgi:hypothetical protein